MLVDEEWEWECRWIIQHRIRRIGIRYAHDHDARLQAAGGASARAFVRACAPRSGHACPVLVRHESPYLVF